MLQSKAALRRRSAVKASISDEQNFLVAAPRYKRPGRDVQARVTTVARHAGGFPRRLIMLFTAHLFDSNPLTALRRSAPSATTTPGLLQARTAVSAPFTHGLPKPQLGREVMLACWEDDDAIDRFLASDALGRQMAAGWHARLELVRAVGIFPGLPDLDLQELAGDKERSMTGPSVAFTLGTAYAKTFPQFFKVNKGLERQFLDTPDTIWGTAMANLRTRFVATLTFWESLEHASDYMKSGAHGAAMRDHYDPGKDPTGHTFVTGGGFLGFRPLSISGSVGGTNAISESLLAAYEGR